MSSKAAATLAGRSGTLMDPGVPRLVALSDLRVGDLLAEGGEGRVFQLPRQPHLLLKLYRQRTARDYLEDLVAWPDAIDAPEASTRIRSAASWPVSVVTDDRDGAVGLLVPRAPRRFSLRHRDGQSRLASLSYLTADPAHRAVAYGLTLPASVSAERVALVYALARLLAAFDRAEPAVAHGDLSTKNVLWSLQRGPEVFVIDCDNAEEFGPDGRPVHGDGRRRAMTPNWDDPAVARGANPTPASDRYSLALIFLRVVGAANFPVQARQRGGDHVEVSFPVPAGAGAGVLLDPAAAVWDLCARALSLTDPAARPTAADWLGPLESLLDSMGAAALMRSVWAAQGGGAPSPAYRPAGERPGDVTIVPATAAGQPERTYSRVSPAPRYGAEPVPAANRPVGYRWVPVAPAPPRLPAASAQSGLAQRPPVRPGPARPGPAPGGPAVTGPPPTWVRPGAVAAGAAPARPPAPARPGGPARPGAPARPLAPAPSVPPVTGPPVAWSAPAAAAAVTAPAPGTSHGVAGGAAATWPPTPGSSDPAGGPGAEARMHLRRFAGWWRGIHRAMVRALRTRGRRRQGVRALLFCILVDLAMAVVAGALVATVVSPIVQG